ncbi:MAG: hypothetical protein FWE28_00625 [Oscillospiraceae bacterium]|nr:hypothetical protein [Oscillospiraceae bacterium]
MKEKTMIDGCTVLHSLTLDGFDHVVAEMVAGTSRQYRLYQGTANNMLGIPEYSMVDQSGDYLVVMREFVRRLGAKMDAIGLERMYRGHSTSTDASLVAEDCLPDGMEADLTGEIVAIREDVFSPEYRTLSHQLHIATGGFGCSPTARGRAVFCTNIYSGKQFRFERSDVLGVVDPDSIPAWAQEKIASLQNDDNRQCESVRDKIAEGRKQQNTKTKSEAVSEKGKDGNNEDEPTR